MKLFLAWLMVVVGVATAIAFLFLIETSVTGYTGRTMNLSLMNQQRNGLLVAGGLIAVGLYARHQMRESRLTRAQQAALALIGIAVLIGAYYLNVIQQSLT